MFKGRSVETKKNLIRLLFERAQRELDLASANLEVTITKTPKQNWGGRGQPRDEVAPNYKVEV
jgi:phenylpyruvate tautomerase PptA (4-oxalocrotonate tautomerase family)